MSIGRGIGRGRLTLHCWMGLQTPVDSTFSSRVPRTIQIIKKVDKIQFSQASTSSSVLTTLDICQHDAKSFVSITESQKLWICFFPDHHQWRTRRKKELFYAISVRESTRHLRCEREVGGYEHGARRPVNTSKNYICQSSYMTKVWRFILSHSMSNGATCKHTGLVVSHNKLDVRMHVPDEYGVLYAKRFGRLLGIKV